MPEAKKSLGITGKEKFKPDGSTFTLIKNGKPQKVSDKQIYNALSSDEKKVVDKLSAYTRTPEQRRILMTAAISDVMESKGTPITEIRK